MGNSLNLSPLGWTVLICLGIFIIILNLSLIVVIRKKTINPPRIIQQDTGKYLRNPWHNEDAQWQKLSQQVAQWKEEKPANKSDSDPDRPAE